MSSLLEDQEVEEAAFAVAERHGFTRAAFLKAGGALIVGIALPSSAMAATKETGKTVKQRATTDADFPTVDPSQLKSWLAVQADGTVVAFTGRVELGQGNQTSLSQIIAEELDVAFEKISLVMGDTARCVDQGVTAASTTIIVGGPQLRQAAADGRQALLEMAAQKLGVPAARLTVRDGVVSDSRDASKHISYGALVHGHVLTQKIPVKTGAEGAFTLGGAKIKAVDDYTIVGQSIARVDIPLKVTAQYEYVQDVKVPGMLHGRVIRPPALGAQLISHGKPPPGVKVVRQKNFLAVAAADEWYAIEAAGNLALTAKWTEWAGLPAMDQLPEYLRNAKSTPLVFQHAGDLQQGLSGSTLTLNASYNTPMETHGSLGPSCAIADVRSDSATIYSGAQGPNAVQAAAAAVLGLKPERVHVISYPASGCYGQNGAEPVVIDAALMSKHLGVPVRVQRMRADEHGWDPKGPPTAHELRVGVDAGGKLVAWDHQAWLPFEYNETIIGSILAGDKAIEPLAIGWQGNMTYDIPNVRLLAHNEGDIGGENNHGVGIISAWLRSPAQFQINFAQESFFDEAAAALKADPLEFRLRHLRDKRFIAVLAHVAKLAGWKSRPSPGPDAHGSGRIVTGRGIAGSLRSGTYNAEIAEVEVDRHTGQVTVTKMWVVQDNGMTINPRAVILGAEAGVVQSVSRTLLEEVTFDRSAITSLDWFTYPILRFNQVPEVRVELIGSQHDAPGGSGEPSCCPVPAAIGNAVYDATGARLRTLPMTPTRVLLALPEV